jgi:hypothetical protein
VHLHALCCTRLTYLLIVAELSRPTDPTAPRARGDNPARGRHLLRMYLAEGDRPDCINRPSESYLLVPADTDPCSCRWKII